MVGDRAEQFDPKERILKLVDDDLYNVINPAEQFDPKERILKHHHHKQGWSPSRR